LLPCILFIHDDCQAFFFHKQGEGVLFSFLKYKVMQGSYGTADVGLLLEASHQVALPRGEYASFVCGNIYSQAVTILELKWVLWIRWPSGTLPSSRRMAPQHRQALLI